MPPELHNSEEIKFIFAGLDNAGKTSFLISLRQKYNFYERVKQLKPTINIEYSSFNFLNLYCINLWDMGGQEKFRKIYTNNPVYFTDTNFLYYLIDVQDELRFEESIQYLSNLLKIFRTLEYSNEIIICFHKYDPKFKNSEDFVDRIEMIKNLILTQNKELKFRFFRTSYYDISSLSKALSYSLNKLLNIERLNSKLETIVVNFNCSHLILYTSDGLIISDYYNKIMDTRDFEEIINSKINENLEFFQRLVDQDVKIDERMILSKENTEYVKKFDISIGNEINTFYIGISTPLKTMLELKKELEKLKIILESTFA
ncbi:MAG: ADP-ribosylation factor-like protein [Candidatus Hodarchaeota archaeon]